MKNCLISLGLIVFSISSIAQNSSIIGVKVGHSIEYPTMTYKISNEDQTSITIRPTSKNFDKYISNKRFEIGCYVSPSYGDTENDEYPELECYIVNNTMKTISVNSLDVNVVESIPDAFPYIYIGTLEDYSNCIYFLNESWTNWGQITFRYKILRKDEEFDGKYEKSITIPYFEDRKYVNLLPDLINKGYNYDAIRKEAIKDGLIDKSDDNKYLYIYIQKKDFQKYKNLFYPFEIEGGEEEYSIYSGFARIFGEISFSKSTHKVSFNGKLSLSTEAGFGADMYEDDKFNVKLMESGHNYVKKFPYVTTIKPGGSEKVRIKLGTNKSTNHSFYISVNNNSGIAIKSKLINLYHLVPKHSSKSYYLNFNLQ